MDRDLQGFVSQALDRLRNVGYTVVMENFNVGAADAMHASYFAERGGEFFPVKVVLAEALRLQKLEGRSNYRARKWTGGIAASNGAGRILWQLGFPIYLANKRRVEESEFGLASSTGNSKGATTEPSPNIDVHWDSDPSDMNADEILDSLSVPFLDLADLRENALLIMSGTTESQTNVSRKIYSRDPVVRAYVTARALGQCDRCGNNAPFENKRGQPYLESHHIIARSDLGSDKISNMAALCPNCHRNIHFGANGLSINIDLLATIEVRYPDDKSI